MAQHEELSAARASGCKDADDDAAQESDLRAQLDEYRSELAAEKARSQSLKARAQSLKGALQREQRLRRLAEQEPEVPTDTPTFKALFFAAQSLGVQDLLELGNASSQCHMLAQEDSLWQVICLRLFRVPKIRHCLNYRAKVLCSVARRAVQKHLALAESERAKRLVYHAQAEAERARIQKTARELSTFVVVWTVSQGQLIDAEPGQCLQSSDFVARGMHGYFSFYPKGEGRVPRCAFYICFMNNRRLRLSAEVYLGERKCMHLWHSWGKKARPGQGAGWSNAGPPFEESDAPLTIWVEFSKLYREGLGDYFCFM